jgi:hypothetical protein
VLLSDWATTQARIFSRPTTTSKCVMLVRADCGAPVTSGSFAFSSFEYTTELGKETGSSLFEFYG